MFQAMQRQFEPRRKSAINALLVASCCPRQKITEPREILRLTAQNDI